MTTDGRAGELSAALTDIAAELFADVRICDHDRNYCIGRFVELVEPALTAARESALREAWVPSSERLPENCARVLGIHPPSGYVYIYYFDNGLWETDDDKRIRKSEFHPQFWMPLPAPPPPPTKGPPDDDR